MKREIEEIRTDVLVIGGGGAGCWAALKASEHDRDVTLLNQYTLGKSGTTIVAMITYMAIMGELGIHPEDTEEIFFQDIVKSGAFLGEQNLIEILVRNSRQTVLDYEKLGVKWDKVDGKFDSRGLPGMTYDRGCFVDHRTGISLQRALVRAVEKRSNIRYQERKVLRLLKDGDRIAGALAMNLYNGAFTKISAKSVVLATGGAGRLYKVTSMPEDARGDGMSLAYQAGATLMDLEFQLFYPTTLIYPEYLRGLVAPRGTTVPLGARILNGKGERFMHRYYPEAELATRDKASISIMREILSGNGTPHGGVYLDLSKVENLIDKYPTSFKDFKNTGINLPDEWLEVCPGHHFSTGGVEINSFCETSVPGLYAAGEVSANLHGANRVGGSALPECAVFGQIAGRHAAIHATFKSRPVAADHQTDEGIERVQNLIERGRKGEFRPVQIMRRLKDLMHEKVGVIRSEKSLLAAVKEIRSMQEMMLNVKINPGEAYNMELTDAIDLENMLLLGELIASSALTRQESRGSHYRLDYPEQDDTRWWKHSQVTEAGGEKRFSSRPVTVTQNR